jgi:hypothetical protein
MSTVRPTGDPGHDPNDSFTDTRTIVIVLLACTLSFGTGLSVAFAIATAAGAGLGIAAGLSAGGTTAVLMINALHGLIRKDR